MSDAPAHPHEVTRSATAQTPAAAAAVSASRRAQPSGWWGMVLFLCSETTLFGTLLATYFYLDFNNRHWPPVGVERPSILGPAVATGALLALSAPIWLGARAGRTGRRGPALGIFAAVTVLQIAYLVFQIHSYVGDLHHLSPQASAYGSIYFTILFADHAHVLLGILLDITVMGYVALRGLNNYWLIGVRGLALYWYVVNVITVLVFLTQISPSM